jgi:hypothetical protein
VEKWKYQKNGVTPQHNVVLQLPQGNLNISCTLRIPKTLGRNIFEKKPEISQNPVQTFRIRSQDTKTSQNKNLRPRFSKLPKQSGSSTNSSAMLRMDPEIVISGRFGKVGTRIVSPLPQHTESKNNPKINLFKNIPHNSSLVNISYNFLNK